MFLMAKQSHMCPICFKSNYHHTAIEVANCRSQMKKRTSNLQRASFSSVVKKHAMEKQHGLCARCGEYWIHADFHHVNNRCDNSLENCVVLCIECHGDVTYLGVDKRGLI